MLKPQSGPDGLGGGAGGQPDQPQVQFLPVLFSDPPSLFVNSGTSAQSLAMEPSSQLPAFHSRNCLHRQERRVRHSK